MRMLHYSKCLSTDIVINTLIMKCFILIRSAETLNMRRINTDVNWVCHIKFTILDLWVPFHQQAYACRNFTTVENSDLSQILDWIFVSLKGVFQNWPLVMLCQNLRLDMSSRDFGRQN